jgi:hypothetical protein
MKHCPVVGLQQAPSGAEEALEERGLDGGLDDELEGGAALDGAELGATLDGGVLEGEAEEGVSQSPGVQGPPLKVAGCGSPGHVIAVVVVQTEGMP